MTRYGNGLLLLLCSALTVAAPMESGHFFVGQDLHLSASSGVWMQEADTGVSWLLLEDGAGLMVGDNQMRARRAVVRFDKQVDDTLAGNRYYRAYVYLAGDVSVERGGRSKTTPMRVVEGADALAVSLDVSGQVLATTDSRTTVTPEAFMEDSLAQQARATFMEMQMPRPIPEAAKVPTFEAPEMPIPMMQEPEEAPSLDLAGGTQPVEPQGVEGALTSGQAPVHVTAVWEPAPEIELMTLADGRKAATVRGRFYLWQQHPERGLIEFLADNAVMYLQGETFKQTTPGTGGNEVGAGDVEAVYFQGNIVMTEGGRVTRADELFYDFVKKEALVVNAEMRTFDEVRQIPVYISAERLRRVSANLFQAENVRLTSSEFYFPQVSVKASRMVLVTPEQLDDQEQAAAETATADQAEQYTGYLKDIRAKYFDFTFFRWPGANTDFIRPDMPLSQIRFGNDSDFGTSLETRWHLARLLGRKEPPGVESRLALDYFSERGYGAGVEAEYERPNSFGFVNAYIMKDRGEDDLGRVRKNLEPDTDTRGRFSFRHREYLPYDWQLTTELSYISDRNFLESMYREEFNTDKAQETLIYLKRLRENTGFSILSTFRINDFETMTEEQPTVEYHMTGESFWDDRFTFYSDSQFSRMRNRFDEESTPSTSGDYFTFVTTRNEADLPILLDTFKLVPYVAGTFDYEDHDEFDLNLDNQGVDPEDNLLLGEYGLRSSTVFWKHDPTVRSEFWDLNGLRHVVTPHAEAAWYEQNDPAIEMRDTYNVGLSQLWQTQRGSAGRQRTVDWMRLNVDTTWVNDPADSDMGSVLYGPASFIYNDPSIPDFLRRGDPYFSMVRNSVNADYEWLVSDTFAFRSDMNYDIHSGQVQQMNVGVSRYVYPDISYYVGSRYLRPLVLDIPSEDIYEEGSHSLVTAMTYRLNERYTAIYAQEYNFDFGKGVQSSMTLIRQYHRLFYGFTVTSDESLDRTGVHFTIWPQGVDDLAIGSRKYMGLTGAIQEY